MQRIGQLFVLHHGPVTITIEGLPDTVLPESLTLDVNIHAGFQKGGYREEIDAFVDAFMRLGGTATFPQADPVAPGSCSSYTVDQGLTSRLTLHPPRAPSNTAPGEDAIRAALARGGQRDEGWLCPDCPLPAGHKGTCKP